MSANSKNTYTEHIGRTITYVVLIAVVIISLMPVVFMWIAALNPKDIYTGDPFVIPARLTLENIVNAWTTGRMRIYMVNSVLVAIPRVAVVLLLSSLAGFAFGKLNFKWKNMIFAFILIGMMVPIQAMIIPLYYSIQRFGLINSLWSMIIPYFGLSMPFACFMMRSFFKDLPDEIMESAMIDGSGNFKTWLYIMMPLVKPAIMSLLVFEFMWSWNDFLLPMLVVYDNSHRTLPLGLMYFQGEYMKDHTLIAAGVTICTLPIISVYIIFQRTFIQGITSGAVKG